MTPILVVHETQADWLFQKILGCGLGINCVGVHRDLDSLCCSSSIRTPPKVPPVWDAPMSVTSFQELEPDSVDQASGMGCF